MNACCGFTIRSAGLLALLCTAAAPAATYTVGAGGTYATIQAAVDAALANAGDDEVRIHVGTYAEHVQLTNSSDHLTISGGWGNGFLIKVRNGAANTIISPSTDGTAVSVTVTGGVVGLDDFTISGAQAANCAGFYAGADGVAVTLTIDGLYVTDNVATASAQTRGGGGCIDALNHATVAVAHSRFAGNAAQVDIADFDHLALGGGLSLTAASSAKCTLTDVTFEGNVVGSVFAQYGAGLDAFLIEGGLDLFDSTFDLQGWREQDVIGVDARVVATSNSKVVIDGNRFVGIGAFADPPVGRHEVFLYAADQSAVQFIDNLVAVASDRGLVADAEDDASLRIGQNTVADSVRATVVHGNSTTPVRLYDNILFDPASADGDLSTDGAVTQTANLVGVDPGFLAPVELDYSLRRGAASPAADAGNPGAVNPIGDDDIVHAARVQGTAIDIGAWESSDRLYADRFD